MSWLVEIGYAIAGIGVVSVLELILDLVRRGRKLRWPWKADRTRWPLYISRVFIVIVFAGLLVLPLTQLHSVPGSIIAGFVGFIAPFALEFANRAVAEIVDGRAKERVQRIEAEARRLDELRAAHVEADSTASGFSDDTGQLINAMRRVLAEGLPVIEEDEEVPH
jgi:hypothetical protein